MKRILIILALTIFNFGVNAQTKNEVMKKIEVDSFDNRMAFDMGSKVLELAKSRNQNIAVEIIRLNHTVFLYVDDNLPMDKHNWLRRKANVAKQFEESSLSVKNDLKDGNMTLKETFALDEKDFLAKGGAIPIFVKGAGMVAIITVSGLHDEEDHKIIIDALKGKYF
ncbi:heme-binding protein [Riemerella anatipestifer]|uniref:heme-degrading domain-containing protein n=1 Tax=Riemerella anatipestifer TaxID=34085 RepID=UPI001374E6DB|nr:heme-binding protein [Riemerella anatipestifer]MDY3364393.1 heme-binding protein [Riemerella anatipestifer]